MDNNWWNYRLWQFVADMNADGSVTISDIWLWFKWLYFMPGDWVIAVTGPTTLGNFLELTTFSYGSFGSGLLSFFAWSIVWGVVLGLEERYQG